MRKLRFIVVAAAFAAACFMTCSAFADSVALGKIEFLVDTNVKMFRFKGDAGQLQSKLDRQGDLLKQVELTIPVSSLKTGMSERDKHMRERIFTKADGTVPDIVFAANPQNGAKCSPGCQVTGTLTIRGQSEPQLIQLTMTDPSHVKGSAQILLSKFGIQDPEQLGVKVSDTIDVNFEVELK